MDQDKKKIVIIGAGIIGLASAVRLTAAGHHVTLVDKDGPGKGTSFGNAGHIATEQIYPLASPQTIASLPRHLLDPTSPIKLPSGYLAQVTPWLLRFAYASRPAQFKRGTVALQSLQTRAMSDLQNLMKIAGHPELLHPTGNLIVVEKEANIAAAKKEASIHKKAGIAVEWISPEKVREMAPNLSPRIVGAIHFTETGHVANPYSISEALEGYLRKNGATIVKDEVLNINQLNQGVTISATSQTLEADLAILSAGAFSKELAKQSGMNIPLETERGYHIHMEGYTPDFSLPVASFERKIIMTPMNDGMRATGIVEFGGLKMPPQERNFRTIKNHVEALVPGIDTSAASTWMGYRPSLPDHLPAIGFKDDNKTLLYAFGHQHLGLTLSGVTAQIVQELAENKAPCVNMAPFKPSRF